MKQNLRELEKQSKAFDSKQRTMEDFFAAAATEESIVEDAVIAEDMDEVTILSDQALEKLEVEVETTIKDEGEDISDIEVKAKEQLQKQINEKEDKNQTIKIIIDTRESKSGIAKELSTLDVDIDLQQLTVADYIVSSRIGIERKDVADFSQSLIDGRLFPQLIYGKIIPYLFLSLKVKRYMVTEL